MTETTKNIIENIYASEVPLTRNSPLNWCKNHGKFIHEDLYRQHNEDLLSSIHATVKALNQTISSLTILLKQADFALNQDIENETNRAINSENAITARLSDEIGRAKEAESKLKSEINGEIQRAQDMEQKIESNVDSESQRAKEAEVQLSSKINNVNNNLEQQLQAMQGQIAALKPNTTNNN